MQYSFFFSYAHDNNEILDVMICCPAVSSSSKLALTIVIIYFVDYVVLDNVDEEEISHCWLQW